MEGLSLIIPARNTGSFIGESIEQYNLVFSKRFKNFEIIVVFNDNWDSGAEKCRELAKKFPLKVIEIPQRGKGYALIRGFEEARFDFIGFMDADNPFSFDSILKMIDSLDFYDGVIASKYLKGRAKNQDFLIRRITSLGGGFISRILFNLKFTDTQAGAKFFRKGVWDKIDKNFICRGFDFDIEFLYKAQRANFKIKEFYTPCKFKKFSTFRLKYLPGILKRLFKLRFLK